MNTTALDKGMPTDSQAAIECLDWDYQAAQSRRERSRFIAAAFGEVSARLQGFLARVGRRAALIQAAQLHRQHQHQ